MTTAPTRRRPPQGRPPQRRPPQTRRPARSTPPQKGIRGWFYGVPWGTGLCAGVSVLLAAAPIAAIVEGASWLAPAAAAVAVVVGVGLLLHRAGVAAVTLAQVLALLGLLTAAFAGELLPGPTAFGEFGELLQGAGDQIRTTSAPVPATPEITFLVTGALGIVAIAVYLAAVGAESPAAAGVPLLATFAVPAALASDLLPWWAMAAAAAGFGLLLVARRGARRQIIGGVALVALASVVALAAGAVFGFVGTSGRFQHGDGSGSGGTTSVGITPFVALRGQLTQSQPTELFRVRGLPRATYLRALTLRDYAPQDGWLVGPPAPGPALPGTLVAGVSAAGDLTDVQIDNVGFRDLWLPLYGIATSVSGLPESRWIYDVRNDTAYSSRSRQDPSWQERVLLTQPTVEQLRDADGTGPGPEFLNVAKVDKRVIDLAKQLTEGAETDFDKAIDLQEFFTGPDSGFRYSLSTAPDGGDDALVEFLTVGKEGFCEQYASAMAVMLRAVGVPARVAIGFTGGVEKGDYRSITTSDAHAWVEAYFPGTGWTTFDPTPLTDGRTITPPYVAAALAERSAAGPGADSTDPRADEKAAAPTTAPPPDEAAQPETPAADTDQGSSVLWWLVPVLAVCLIAVLLAVPAALRGRASRRRMASTAAGGSAAAGAAWAELVAGSVDRGVPMSASDTVRAGARRMVREHQLDAAAQQALREVVSAVESSWYGGGHPAPGELDAPLRRVRDAVAGGSRLGLRDRLLPRSVMEGSVRRRRRHDDGAGQADRSDRANDDRAVSRR